VKPARLISRAAFRKARKLLRDRRGLAATEFAMLVPLMLVVFVGVSEVGQAISISRKVTITVRTVTDLVTQYSALSTSDMTNLLNAASQVIAPYPSSNLTITVSEVQTDSKSNATVTWSSAVNGTAYTNGQKVTLPSGISQPNVTVIWGQVHYAYTPVLGDKIIGTTNLSDQLYMNPRLCTAIAYGSSVSTSTLTTNCASQ
jgi:Flp pilus assembly protein TadG